MSVKTDRIASNLIKEISYIIANEIKDKDIKFVTITDCKLTTDLSFAKIYYTTLSNDKNTTEKALKNASSYIRRELAERVDIRHIPVLQFIFDESIEYGNKIENILEKIHNEDREA